MILRSAIIVGLCAILAAIAAPPGLRAGSKMAYLMVKHGLPYHLHKNLYRIPFLSNVDPETCGGNPTGRYACYLVLDERDANLAEYQTIPEWQREHVHEWFVLLQNVTNTNGEEVVDFQHLLHTVLGEIVPDSYSAMTEDDFNAVMGAAERSLKDADGDFGDEDARPIFEWTDKNGDGMLTLEERTQPMEQDCTEQAGETFLCDFYVRLLQEYMPSYDMTYDQWMQELLSDGASVHDEVSGQFSSLF
mmetsp:Transcript_5031/g.11091  ORF Transcript_5031/g.11091 Transcript_5031/m.11091 type:complete len:247 (-) Transcript_5031:238-978(-)